MDKILIGSKAIKTWFKDFNRNGKDTDYAVLGKTKTTKKVEYLHNPILFKHLELIKDGVLKPDGLYTLKMSHLAHSDIFWEKHLYDLLWLKDKGCKVIKPLFYELYGFWEKHHKNKRSDLNMNSKDFFDNAVRCEYDHDYLHTLIKEIPTYTKVLCDNEEVLVCEGKFNKLSFDEKCDLVREEVMIMSWERFPNLKYYRAYNKMLKKFILSHAPLWEVLFILDNYNSLYKPTFNYYERITKELEARRLSKTRK